jgi:hypothetical protein
VMSRCISYTHQVCFGPRGRTQKKVPCW